jgi:hypothetical protein
MLGGPPHAGAGRTQLYVDIETHSRRVSKRRSVDVSQTVGPDWRELRVLESDEATLSSRTMATITAAGRTIYPYDASLDDVYARAKEQLDEAVREDFAAVGTIAYAVARGLRRHRR